MKADDRYLVLENGQVFAGKGFGSAAEGITGEVVFATGMAGYLETLTDPSYYGQIVVQTFPLIGNYGVIPADFESARPYLKAYVVREWCQDPSNYRSEGDLDTFLKDQGIPGLCGVDTRDLTKLLREYGVMNGILTSDPDLSPEKLEAVRRYRVSGAVAAVSGGARRIEGEPNGRKVVLWDFGAKENISRELAARGCGVIPVPWDATAMEIRALKPDGVMLSNGPGDPAENQGVIRQIAELCRPGDIPVFGICLGHQLLALAKGAKTGRLPYGHRGANQPVREIQTGKCYITSQNHGYAVTADSLPAGAELWFENVSDGTCEGIFYRDTPAFSVQFHPEACGGPRDTGFLFDRFLDCIQGKGDVFHV